MAKFKDIPLTEEFAGRAFDLIEKFSKHLTNNQFSTVELRLDEEDYMKLLDWLALPIEKSRIQRAMINGSYTILGRNRHSDDTVIGVLLLCLYAEHSRRYGTEGAFWPTISELRWPEHIKQSWFLNNKPTENHKSVLLNAARRFGLRNAFEEGGQEWFITCKLQYGFTLRGAEENLHEWLSSDYHLTRALRVLKGIDDTMQKSDSLFQLFTALYNYRRGNLKESKLRVLMESSEWILPKWVDKLITISRKDIRGQDTPDDENGIEFLSQPRIKYNEDFPFFEIEPVGLATISLEDKDHEITDADGNRLILLKYQENVGFHASPPSIRIEWKHGCKEQTYILRETRAPEAVAGQNIICWNPDEWIQIFSSQGKRYSSDQPVSQRILEEGFSILCPITCKISPVSVSKIQLDDNWTLHKELNTSLGKKISAHEDEELIWDSDSAKSPTVNFKQTVENLYAYPITGTFGETTGNCRLSITMKDGWAVDMIRIGNQHSLNTEKCASNDGCTFPINQNEWLRPLTVILRVRNKAERSITGITTTRINLKPKNFAWIDSKKRPDEPLNYLFVGKDSITEIATGDSPSGESMWMIEGSAFRNKCPQSKFAPKNLAGVGEKLELWEDLFNQHQELHIVAKECIDQGIIRKCIYTVNPTSPGDLLVKIELTNNSGTSDEVKWYAFTTGPLEIILNPHIKEGKKLEFYLPQSIQPRDLLCIIATFEGRRVGTWHHRQHTIGCYKLAEIVDHDQKINDAAYAMLLRASKFPVLSTPSDIALKSWITNMPTDAFLALLSKPVKESKLSVVEQPSSMSAWNRAIGMVYEKNITAGCRNISCTEAESIIKVFMPEFETSSALNPEIFPELIKAIKCIAQISPILARDTIKCISSQFNSANSASQWIGTISRALRVTAGSIDEISKGLRINLSPDFFENSIRVSSANQNPIQKRNLQLLLNLPCGDNTSHPIRNHRTSILLYL